MKSNQLNMDDQIKTEILEKELQIIVGRLAEMNLWFMSADASSFLKSKSFYQQVVSLRNRFYEILPVLQCKLDNAALVKSTINAQIVAINAQGISLPVAEPTTSSMLNVEQTSLTGLNLNDVPSSAAGTEPAHSTTESYMIEILHKVAEKVHAVTTDIEERYFALEAEYNKKQMLEFITEPALKDVLNGQMISSSITLNVDGSITLKISDKECDNKTADLKSSSLQKHVEKRDKIVPQKEEQNDFEDQEEIERRKDLFYGSFGDTVLQFADGNTLKVCVTALIYKSSAFDVFLTRPNELTINYDITRFKLFLDSLMEFQEISVTSALQIFEIACKFKVKRFVEKLVNILKPVDVNENISLLLNMAVACNNDELLGVVINFLKEKEQIFTFFYEERYYFLLEPESVKILLNYFEMDSFLLKKIFLWGENYLKEHNLPNDLKLFFRKCGIMDILAKALFETFGVQF